MSAHIGMDSRVDAEGVVQPWRIVVLDDRFPSRRREWRGSLPDGVYVSPPRHPVHGDLLDIGPGLIEQAGDIAVHLVTQCENGADVVESHSDLALVRDLRDRGARIDPVPTETPLPGELADPYGIGGYAGHDIATLARLAKDSAA